MTPERLEELIDRFPSRRIAVFGDFFLDRYLEADPALAEVSLETGKTAHQIVSIRRSPGAAGTVVNNLSALGASATYAVGATGDDGEAYDLRKALGERGCDVSGLLQFDSLMTPTYLKPRDVTNADLTGEHERYGTKNRRPTPAEVIEKVIPELDRVLPKVDAVIIADQVEEDECGIITAAVREVIAQQARKHPKIIFWADSRRRIRLFRNVMIKPNQFEAVAHDNPLPGEEIEAEQIKRLIRSFARKSRARVFATRGARGILVSDPEPTEVPGVRLKGPIDPTGAGDSVTAGAVLALSSGAGLPEAALAGILVSSITVQQLATTGTATPQQVRDRLRLWRQQHCE